MPLVITPREGCLTRIHSVAAWICAVSLVIVLANRFPRIEGNEESSWVACTTSHTTAKVMAKDFFVLPSPAAVRLLLPRSVPARIEVAEELPAVSVALDNRLFTRPPPAA